MTAREEPPDRLELLRERHAERLRTAERIRSDLDFPPRLRDRTMFFHHLLNGERDTYERVRPLWRQYRHNIREAARLEADIATVVREKVEREPGYRALDVSAAREKKAERSCQRLLSAIRAARKRIVRANTSDAATAVLDRDARDVSAHLRTVRQRADDLSAALGGRRSCSHGALGGLEISFSHVDDHRDRRKRYTEARAALGRLEKNVRDLLRTVAARERDVEAGKRRYLKDGQARYDR